MYLLRVLAFSICAIIFAGLIFVSCDSQIQDSTEEDKLIDMVEAPITYTSNTGRVKGESPGPKKNPAPYYCLVSTLNPDGREYAYTYRRYDLDIPKGLVRQAQEENTDNKWVTYRFADERALQRTEADTMGNRGLLRMARCRLPAVPAVVQHMRRQFTKFDSQSWIHGQESTESHVASNTDSTEAPDPLPTDLVQVCTAVIDYYICNEPNVTNPSNTPGCTYIGSECVEYTLIDTGGGDPPPESPGGSSGDEGDPCEPCEPSMPCSLQPGGGEGTTPEGCEVDTDYEIYVIEIDSSFSNNPCLSSVYNQAGQAPTYNNILNNFDGQLSVANLTFSAGVDQTYPNALAVTYPPQNYNIEIKFNPNNLSFPTLEVAGGLIHELIHAELYRKLLSAAQKDEIPWSESFINSIRNDFPGIFYYYTEYENWQHQQMASHYRSTMEQALQEFDGSYSNEIYEALTWNGLQGTIAWNNQGADTTDIIQTIGNFRQNNSSCD